MSTRAQCDAARDAAVANAIDAHDAALTACINGPVEQRTACMAGAAATLVTLFEVIAKEHANCVASTVPGLPLPFPNE